MAYENYYFVSWANGTPLSADRLAQMSTNIEQVKEVVDLAPKGILSYKTKDTAVPNTTGWTTFTEHEIIHLRYEGSFSNSTEDNRVTLGAGRMYKLNFNLPHIFIHGPGCEDSRFVISLYKGTDLANANTALQFWDITPHTYSYINVASAAANISNEALKTSNVHVTRIGAGTYSYIGSTDSGFNNQSFFITIRRTAGANTNNAPAWHVNASAGTRVIAFWAEDIGILQ